MGKVNKNSTAGKSDANLKRLESLKNLKDNYHNKKSLIKSALANIDVPSKNKIVFSDTAERYSENNCTNESGKKTLFNENDSEEEFEPTFSVKEHFQGKEGQKLLELQSKFKNDKRFTLDERFLENNEAESVEVAPNQEANEDVPIEEEKKREYEILEQVLGKKIAPKEKHEPSKKKMLRFDPSQPEHSKYEIPKAAPEKKSKRKRKNSEAEVTDEKKQEEKAAPEVSKEVFFQVSDNLKQTFEEQKEFSLLSMFGQQPEEKRAEEAYASKEHSKTLTNGFHKEKNPFRYDSSDDEDETRDVQESNKNQSVPAKNEEVRKKTSWTEPFFFKLDDFRLQEGFDFLEKMQSEETTEFKKLRRDLKEIVKAKVRNNLRKNKPFKKKLGGNRKKKVLRLKKAMKR
ncbi:unnamed protein product [Phyllotreta striolata]|uniref:Uncharacterized protein n=1 Tax=Phyllotreta striolata TaxID=444603 RepID=A0A9N9TV22_PHYSR|nr:unnamed protein product [Phyllotreta striolata]